MSIEKDDGVVAEAAAHLLANRHRHGVEGNVQSDVEALLRSMGVGTIESHYQLASGQADIYLPNRRTFIECKAYPKAAKPDKEQSRKTPESPRQQLDRYVRAEIESELHMMPGMSPGIPDGLWTGIVTDGSHWHVYRYAHESGAEGQPEAKMVFLNESDALAAFLGDTLGGEMVGKEWIPESPGELFSELKRDLDELYRHLPKKATKTTETKRKLWKDLMETSGMVPTGKAGERRLFLAHSFLIAVVRLVSHTLAGPRQGEEWKSALNDGFASWVLDFSRGERWAERVWDLVDGYDWRRRRGDVLRELYHRYVPEEDRKVFGEFYTPDWLAALMVEEVLDDAWIEDAAAAALGGDMEGVGVLDPACGSGTFLYHAALRILGAPSVQGSRPVEKANVVARLVNGIDIHPVAVEMARVNLERALPAEPTDGASAFQVFLGDSLQTATHGELFGHTGDAVRLLTPQGRETLVPMDFVRSPSFAEDMRRMVNAASEAKPLPPGIAGKGDRAAMQSCHKQLTETVKEEGDSVWTWYVVNLVGPHLLAERKIDRMVGNPPWVKLAEIQVKERKQAMEKFGADLELQGGGKLAPHLDIASFFVIRTRDIYSADPDRNPGSWLVKKSAIGAGQWELFRRKHRGTLAQSVDLEDLNPFGGGDATRCCLLMEHRRMRGTSSPRIEAKRVGRRRPTAQEGLNTARARFEFVEVPDPLPQAASAYDDENIRQGLRSCRTCWLWWDRTRRPPGPGGRTWKRNGPRIRRGAELPSRRGGCRPGGYGRCTPLPTFCRMSRCASRPRRSSRWVRTGN